VLAATALFGSFRTEVERALVEAGSDAPFNLSIEQPNLLFGLIIGAAVVFLFSGLAIQAVSRAAGRVVFEVREQFRTKPGIMDYTEKPDYARVVDICTKDSLRELATPACWPSCRRSRSASPSATSRSAPSLRAPSRPAC
jgi:K(+)-stimulated pyrophosphate-energized sodium pump